MSRLNQKKLNVDVCVIGGGMAGICAAISSARNGAQTVLVHDRPVLGGNASSEIRMWICGAHGKQNKETGILEEIQLANLQRNPALNYSIWDSVLWEKVYFQPRLTTLFNCTCMDASMEDWYSQTNSVIHDRASPDLQRQNPGDLRIASITAWQMDTQTRFAIEADQFIDCSGDSILAALTPAKFRHGREAESEFGEDLEPETADKKTMGSSLLIQTHRCTTPQPFTPPKWAYKFDPQDLSYRVIQNSNFWWLEIGGIQDTIKDNALIRDELMRIVYGIWDYIKNRWEKRDKMTNFSAHWIGSLPGKRESRRYVGAYMMTQSDIESGGEFEDTVAFGGWPIDDHHPAGLFYPGSPNTVTRAQPEIYGIPYRALYSKNIDNLLFAGRNISATHAALSSTRVMGTCAVIGQAAGTAAALCNKYGCAPNEISSKHIKELQQTLMDDDCFLPRFTRNIDGFATSAKISGGGEGLNNLTNGLDRDRKNENNSWQGEAGDKIEFHWDRAVAIKGLRITFDSNLNHDKRMTCAYPVKADRCAVPGSLVKAYAIEALDENGNWQQIYHQDENIRRLVCIPLSIRAKAVRFIPESTWGDKKVRIMALQPQANFEDKIPDTPQGPSFSAVRAQLDPADLAAPAKDVPSKESLAAAYSA